MNNEKTIATIILTIVAIVLIFNIVGGTSENLKEGAEGVSEANNCSVSSDPNLDTSLWYNSTDQSCYNGTESTTTRNECSSIPEYNCSKVHGAELYSLPLSSLFSPSGVIMLIVMAGILISVVAFVLKKKSG